MKTSWRRAVPPGASLVSFAVLAALCGAWVIGCSDATGPDAALEDDDLGDMEEIERDPPARTAVAEAFDTLPPRLFGSEDSEDIRRIRGRVQSILGNMRETAYVHDDGMEINESKGVYKYDCSGFVGSFVLEDTLPTHYQRLLAGAQQHHQGFSRRMAPGPAPMPSVLGRGASTITSTPSGSMRPTTVTGTSSGSSRS